jgi:hypothetical protein
MTWYGREADGRREKTKQSFNGMRCHFGVPLIHLGVWGMGHNRLWGSEVTAISPHRYIFYRLPKDRSSIRCRTSTNLAAPCLVSVSPTLRLTSCAIIYIVILGSSTPRTRVYPLLCSSKAYARSILLGNLHSKRGAVCHSRSFNITTVLLVLHYTMPGCRTTQLFLSSRSDFLLFIRLHLYKTPIEQCHDLISYLT